MTISKKICLCVLCCFVLIFSCFSFLGVGGGLSVSADSTISSYSFVGSDLYLPNLGVSDTAPSSFKSLSSFRDLDTRVKFYLDYSHTSSVFSINFSGSDRPSPFTSFSQNPSSRQHTTYSTSSSNSSYFGLNLSFSDFGSGRDYTKISNYTTLYAWRGGSIVYYSSLYAELVYTGDLTNSFLSNYDIGNVVSVEFGNYSLKSPYVLINDGNTTPDAPYSKVSGSYYNYISYIFNSGYRLNLLIPTTNHAHNSYSYYPYAYFQTRVYDLPNTVSNDYLNGYDIGYSEGFNTGNTEGYDKGYDKGYDLGHNIGYNSGYSQGVENANDYSFTGLIGATIDAPIKYFQSLFNFELLGVNLQGFLTGLFTLCVIVTIIKMCLGGH